MDFTSPPYITSSPYSSPPLLSEEEREFQRTLYPMMFCRIFELQLWSEAIPVLERIIDEDKYSVISYTIGWRSQYTASFRITPEVIYNQASNKAVWMLADYCVRRVIDECAMDRDGNPIRFVDIHAWNYVDYQRTLNSDMRVGPRRPLIG